MTPPADANSTNFACFAAAAPFFGFGFRAFGLKFAGALLMALFSIIFGSIERLGD
jgi:hypothetical protein